jgi:RHS repeat-associated protein
VLSASLRETNLKYDSNGNLTKFGDWSYVYDSGSRLVSVSSNNTVVATFAYDTQGRRVKKVAADETHRYFYDGQLLVYEHITRPDNTVSEIDYVWGNDISGTRDGACGIGGLLYLKRNGVVYIPFFDAYGNVLGYTDAHGNVEAEYTYDPFGNIVGKSGAKSDDFAFRFSTKYYDVETDLYYYIYRYYKPNLMRWLSEDPIAEDGGLNLYAFCGNNPVCRYDEDGRAYFAYRPLDNSVTHMTGIIAATSEFMKKKNWVVAHEQLIFEDGGSPVNIGYFDAPIGDNNPRQDEFHFQTQYVPIEGKGAYNDCVMREAVKNVTPRPYNLWTWAGRSTGQYNCQDYADDLRSEYYRLLLDIKIRCKCNLRQGRIK